MVQQRYHASMNDLLRVLRRMIRDEGISLRELERRSGVNRPRITDCLEGRGKPKFSTIAKLFATFGYKAKLKDLPNGDYQLTLKRAHPFPSTTTTDDSGEPAGQKVSQGVTKEEPTNTLARSRRLVPGPGKGSTGLN